MMSGGSEAVMTSVTSTTTTNHHYNINMEPPSPPLPPPFTLTSPTSHSQPQPVMQNMSFAGYNPSEGIMMNSMGQQPIKKKRGRPRKYGPDGSMGFSLSGTPQTSNVGPTHHHPGGGGGGGFPPPPPVVVSGGGEVVVSATPVSTSMKKRGRPPGSGKKHLLEAMGSAGFGFTPHIITVKAGEDVSSKIMSFSQNGPRAVCILSANGSISNVTLRQPATSGGTVTYEGRFEILSLSGSYLPSDDGGQRSRTGGLSISLSGPDGRVLGGGVAGLLVAAAPVQVVVGSFVAEGRKDPKPVVTHAEPLSAAMRLTSPGSTGGGSPQSRGTLSESSGGPGSPLNQISGACNNNNPQSLSGISWK